MNFKELVKKDQHSNKTMIFVGHFDNLSIEDQNELSPLGEIVAMSADVSSKPYSYWVEEKFSYPYFAKRLSQDELSRLKEAINEHNS